MNFQFETRSAFARCLLTFALAAACMAAVAQTYPTKPILLLVSFSAGGNNDLRARQLSQPVGAALGQSVIVDNRPGASGNIGHDLVARAAGDGYTLGIAAMGPMTVNPSLFPKMSFDPVRDLMPVVLVEKSPLVLVVRADKPLRNARDVIVAAKAGPGTLTIGNAGTGGAHHLSSELFQDATGIRMIDVPYKGGGPAATALLSGEIDMMFEQTYSVLPSLQAGKIRALAVTSEKRLPSLPDVPTMTELGYAQVTVSNWLGVVVPKNTPPAIVDKLNAAFNKALAAPDMREKIIGPGNVIGGGSPSDFAALIASDSKRWAALIKAKGIKME